VAQISVLVVTGLLLWGGTSHAQEEDLKDCDKYFERGELRKAASACDRAIKKWPKQVPPGAYAKRAAMFIIQKRYKAGLQFISQKAETVHANAAEILEQKGIIFWALRSKVDAVAACEAAVKSRSTSFLCQNILGEWYTNRGQPRKASAALESYLKNRPSELSKGDVLPLIRLGFSYLALGKHKDAEKSFQSVLDKHKKRPHAEVNANNGLCAAYTAQGKFDRAITVCEKIIQNPRNIDRHMSVYYNLGQSYLHKKQSKRARQMGQNYSTERPKEPKGYILTGDAFFQEQDWANALRFYQLAERNAKGRRDLAARLAIKLGTTYRRMENPGLAIKKLEQAAATDPRNVTLAAELGASYIAVKDDDKALARVEPLIKADPKNVDLLVISGRALYNKGKYEQSLQRYQQAYEARPDEAKIRIGLVQAVNVQAYRHIEKKQLAKAEKLLLKAHGFDKSATLTNKNLAVMAISANKCDRAIGYLGALKNNRGSALIYHRLMGRAHLCKPKRDESQARTHYKKAADLAKKTDKLLLAEIYTEWAPLLVKTDLEGAATKLSAAVSSSSRNPEIGKAAKRNLAVVLFRRGWARMRSGKREEAIKDFDRAALDERVLDKNEANAFNFSLALALLESSRQDDIDRAGQILAKLGKQGGQNKYLKAPYNKLGTAFFSAYAGYRSRNKTQLKGAAATFRRLVPTAKGNLGKKVRDLVSASYQEIAYNAYRTKNAAAARNALKTASQFASAAAKKDVAHNQAVLSGGSEAVYKKMNGNPAESLVNLGIAYHNAGKPKEAFDAWNAAKRKGAKAPNLDKWIATKKRIFGYN
jgi:tetratricopeptide (TPR) repeat protein